MINNTSEILITIGFIMVAVAFLWPIIRRFGFGQLPGDIVIDRGNFKIYLPITTSLIISLILTLILWLIR